MNLQEFTTQAEKEFDDAVPTFHSQECEIGKCTCEEDIRSFLRSQLEGLAREMAEAVRVVKSEINDDDTTDIAIYKSGVNLIVLKQDLKLKTFLGDIK